MSIQTHINGLLYTMEAKMIINDLENKIEFLILFRQLTDEQQENVITYMTGMIAGKRMAEASAIQAEEAENETD